MAKKVIITGGAGFVGANLARKLQLDSPDTKILIIDDFRTGCFANLVSTDLGQGPFVGDVISRSVAEVDWVNLIGRFKPDVIFHEASITDTTISDQAVMLADNVEPFRVLVELAVESGIKLVWASSAATYGTQANGACADRRPFGLEDAGRPANVYGFSKWVMENIQQRTIAEHASAHVVGLRYFNVFGPGEQNKGHMASMVYQLAQQMLNGNRPRIFTDGQQARDQVFVSDVVDATIAAASDEATSGIYNVGSGGATTFNQIIAALNEAMDSEFNPDYFENPYAFYQDYTCADLTSTKAGIGWQPRCDVYQSVIEYGRLLKSRHV